MNDGHSKEIAKAAQLAATSLERVAQLATIWAVLTGAAFAISIAWLLMGGE